MKKKTLVVFYSRHGHTSIVSKTLAKLLKADVEEIIDLKSRKNIISWAKNAFNSQIRKPTKIKRPVRNPLRYGLVVVGTPIWDGVTPAVRRYLHESGLKDDKDTKVGFFATFGASEGDAFITMEKLSKKPVAKLGLQDREIILGQHIKKIKDFSKRLKKGL